MIQIPAALQIKILFLFAGLDPNTLESGEEASDEDNPTLEFDTTQNIQ